MFQNEVPDKLTFNNHFIVIKNQWDLNVRRSNWLKPFETDSSKIGLLKNLKYHSSENFSGISLSSVGQIITISSNDGQNDCTIFKRTNTEQQWRVNAEKRVCDHRVATASHH